MSWFKDNKFLVALLGITLAAAILLILAGSKAATRHQQSKEEFDSAAAEAANYERLALYPRPENRDGKSKALDEYRQAVEALQAAFEPFRPKAMPNVSPQDFTNRLKSVNDGIRKAFEDSQTKLPEAFFCGFENYKTTLARGNATGILEYQLAAIQNLMLALAQSGATELKNLHRPLLPEEQGTPYQPQPAEIARPLPLEITFLGPEKAARQFLSSIVKPDGQYFVIRSLRVTNAKKDPPRAADAKFDKPPAAPAPAATAAAAADLLGGLSLPGDKPADGSPAPAPVDSSRVLSQVLGNEEVQVFLRLDLMQFLPAKPLP